MSNRIPMPTPQVVERNGVRIVRARSSIAISRKGETYIGPDGESLAEVEKEVKRGCRRIGPLTYVVW